MFDVVSALEGRKRRKRLRFIGFSAAIHLLVFGTIVAASLWQVGDIDPANVIRIVFVPDPPPLGPAGGGGRPPGDPPHRNPPQHGAPAPPMVQPSAISTSLPPVLPSMDVEPLPGNGPAATGQNPAAGPGGGDPDSPCLPGADCGHGPSGTIYQPGGNVRAPVGISQPEPKYPGPAQVTHQQGVVILQAIIGTDGSVENVGVLKSAAPLLDEAALEAVRRWRYTPATLNGRAVRVFLTVTVNFTLR